MAFAERLYPQLVIRLPLTCCVDGSAVVPENAILAETDTWSRRPARTSVANIGECWRNTDELIWIEKNGDPAESNDTNPDDQSGESTADSRYFVHQDRNWNVVALSEYDTSGTNDGRIVERYSYTPYGSFVVLNGDSGSGELGNASLASTIGNVFAHQGLPFDQDKGCYQNRWREYNSQFYRYTRRDQYGLLDRRGRFDKEV